MLKDTFYSRKLIYAPLLLLVMLLTACGNDDEYVSANLNEIVVDNEYVSMEYEDFIFELVNEYDYMLEMLAKDMSSLSNINKYSTEYISFVTTERVNSQGKAEDDIDSYISKFISSSKLSAEYFIKYSNSEDKTHADIANDYKRDALGHLDVVINIAEKYGIK